MIRSNAFDYISLMDKAADASWLRETALSNNIANVDTPGYKRQDVRFQDILEDQLDNTKYKNLDQAVNSLDYTDSSSLKGEVYTDYPSFDYRLDTNNVDVDNENVEYASEQLRYQALTTAISGDFQCFNAVTRS